MAATHLSALPPCPAPGRSKHLLRGLSSRKVQWGTYGTRGYATIHRCEWIRACISMGLARPQRGNNGKEPRISLIAGQKRGCINAMDHIKPLNQRARALNRNTRSSSILGSEEKSGDVRAMEQMPLG